MSKEKLFWIVAFIVFVLIFPFTKKYLDLNTKRDEVAFSCGQFIALEGKLDLKHKEFQQRANEEESKQWFSLARDCMDAYRGYVETNESDPSILPFILMGLLYFIALAYYCIEYKSDMPGELGSFLRRLKVQGMTSDEINKERQLAEIERQRAEADKTRNEGVAAVLANMTDTEIQEALRKAENAKAGLLKEQERQEKLKTAQQKLQLKEDYGKKK